MGYIYTLYTVIHRISISYVILTTWMYIYICIFWLVVWNMNFICPYIGNVIIPADELIFFRGVGIPPTRWFSDVYWTIVEAH